MDIQTPQQELEPHKNWFSSHKLLGYVFLAIVLLAAASLIYYFEVKNKDVPFEPVIHKDNYQVCIQVIQKARNPQTGEVKEFPTPCDVPEGWEKVESESLK